MKAGAAPTCNETKDTTDLLAACGNLDKIGQPKLRAALNPLRAMEDA
jgi:hypothetical protein